jgi:hypothetical protein
MAYKNPADRRAYHRAYQEKIRKANPTYARDRSRRFRAKYPAYARDFKRRADGLPVPARPEPEWCDCCGRFLEKTPHLDHDHVTGKFRGWICGPCNHALGLLGDNVEGVEKAVAYLKRVQ